MGPGDLFGLFLSQTQNIIYTRPFRKVQCCALRMFPRSEVRSGLHVSTSVVACMRTLNFFPELPHTHNSDLTVIVNLILTQVQIPTPEPTTILMLAVF